MDQDWTEYHCKSGQTLFLYNKVTGEHKWPHGLGDGIQGRIIYGRPVTYKEYRSSSMQTDDNGCNNGCMSMYINRDASHVSDLSTIYDGTPRHQSTVADNQDSLNIEHDTIEDREEEEQSGDFESSMQEAHGSLRKKIAQNSDDGDDDDNDEDGGLDSDDGHRDDNNDDGDHGSDSDDLDDKQNDDKDYVCGDDDDQNVVDDDDNILVANSDQDEYIRVDSNGANGHGDVLSCQESESFVKHTNKQGRNRELRKTSRIFGETRSSTANNVMDNNTAVNAHDVSKSPSDNTDGIDVIIQEKSKRPTKNEKTTARKHHECSVCKKVFESKFLLKRHVPVHTGQRPFECSVCQKTFARKDNFNQHLKIHDGEKPFECSYCNKNFTKKSTLKIHLRIHTGEEIFECSYCEKRFAAKFSWIKHIRTHTGEKPFECSYCNKIFSLKHNLIKHIRTHTGEKPFECSYCKKLFSLKYNLKDHIRTHTGEKPFECSYCKKLFTQKRSMKRHLMIHTGEKLGI